jgi:hypothetical protein
MKPKMGNRKRKEKGKGKKEQTSLNPEELNKEMDKCINNKHYIFSH